MKKKKLPSCHSCSECGVPSNIAPGIYIFTLGRNYQLHTCCCGSLFSIDVYALCIQMQDSSNMKFIQWHNVKGGLEINVLKQSENVTPSWRDKVAITTQDQRASKNNCPANTGKQVQYYT